MALGFVLGIVCYNLFKLIWHWALNSVRLSHALEPGRWEGRDLVGGKDGGDGRGDPTCDSKSPPVGPGSGKHLEQLENLSSTEESKRGLKRGRKFAEMLNKIKILTGASHGLILFKGPELQVPLAPPTLITGRSLGWIMLRGIMLNSC